MDDKLNIKGNINPEISIKGIVQSDNELDIKGTVQPEITIRGKVSPEISINGNVIPSVNLRGLVQKGVGASGSGNANIIMKTKEEWAALPTYESIKGYVYVYTNWYVETNLETGEEIWTPRIKIGDGIKYVEDLQFEGYPPIILNDLLTMIKVGGINTGITYDQGTLIETILRDMLCPTMYPKLTNPSLTLTASGSLLLEKGTSKMETITANFNRGSINPAYGTSGYRSGEAQTYKLNNGNEQDLNIFTVALDQIHNTFIGTVVYAEGEQPKDSSGNNYDNPFPAGSINSSTLTFEFVNAIWANESNAEIISKCELVSYFAKQKIFTFPNCSITNPEVFDVPSSWTITAIEVKNDLNNLFEDCSVEFSLSDVEHSNAGGNTVAYTRYTCNLGYDMASRTIRIKWA